MLIQRLEVRNFRSARDVTLDCGALTSIVGRNGVGKSTLLYALDLLYNPAATVKKEDFFDHDESTPIEVRVTYAGLTDAEETEFSAYTHNGKLTVTKRFSGTGTGKYHGASSQVSEFAALRKLASKREMIAEYKELVRNDGRFADLSDSVRSADATEEQMRSFEQAHPEETQLVEREHQFFGATSVGGGKLDNFTKFILVPAVRDAADEAEKKGMISQLIDMIVLRQVNQRQDVQELQEHIDQRVREVFNNENLRELGALGQSVSEILGRYAPGSSFNLSFSEPVPPSINLPPALAKLIEHEFECPISHAGHGLQRTLVMSLLEHLAKSSAAPSETEGEETEGAEIGEQAVPDPDLIIAIEEPELYLHPNRCRFLNRVFRELTTSAPGTKSGRNQILYATHSPYFVDLDGFDELRMARSVIEDEDHPRNCTISFYTKEAAAKELARVAEADPAAFTAESFQARASSVLTTTTNEGFFADRVVVVEGPSEFGALMKLQELMDRNWVAKDIGIVQAVGKTNIDRLVVVFRGLGIPTYMLFDADADANDVITAEHQATNARLARLGNDDPDGWIPSSQAHDLYAVLKRDLEAEIRLAIGGDSYEDMRSQVAAEFGYKPSDVMKNADCTSRLIELIYEAGKRVKILEEVIGKVEEVE